MPLHALIELDPERVVYVGTFSKNLYPVLRLGYIVVPQDILEPLLSLKRLTDMQCPTLPQITLSQFIADRHLERHITRMKRIYNKRRNRLITKGKYEESLIMRFGNVTEPQIAEGIRTIADLL